MHFCNKVMLILMLKLTVINYRVCLHNVFVKLENDSLKRKITQKTNNLFFTQLTDTLKNHLKTLSKIYVGSVTFFT